MLTSALEFLVCPKCFAEQRLQITDSLIPTICRTVKGRESLWEGTIKCTICGTLCPIIHGLPLLLAHVTDYLSRRKHELIQIIAKSGASDRCREFVFDAPNSIYGVATKQESWESTQGLDIYLQAHYGEPVAAEIAISDLPSGAFFYDSVSSDLRQFLKSDATFFLDVGCGVGGFLHRLADRTATSVGIDTSFAAAVLARDLLSIEGCDAVEYTNYTTSFAGSSVTIAATPRERVFILVADAQSLPLKQHVVDFALAANVLDISSEPLNVVRHLAQRLQIGGSLCTISPYYWRPDRAPPSKWLTIDGHDDAESLKMFLQQLGFSPHFERDRIPWVLRYYERYFQVCLCHMLVSKLGTVGSR